MQPRLKPLRDQVIVVTGASSGIGLATALAAARRGAKVVLVARNEVALRAAVDRIVAQGGDATWAVADVASADALVQAARIAVERFGRIDTWVNNAGVALLGPIETNRVEDMRRLFETNFWGVVHGSRVALPYLKERGGALINVGSLESDRAVPLQGLYSASKHAVRGFTDALRVELAHEKAPVSVTLIKPGAIGTPLIRSLRNDMPGEARLPPPIYVPEDAADTILRAAERPTRAAFVGGFAALASAIADVFPRMTDWVSDKVIVDYQVRSTAPTPTDNLFTPRSQATVRDADTSMRRSTLERLRANPSIGLAFVALAAVTVVGAVTSLGERARDGGVRRRP